jgi:RNA polymerase sigma-70 factor (ECF subfamily)
MNQHLQLADAAVPAPDDLALARRACQDPRAFGEIMRRHNQRLYRLAVGIMGEKAEAEDVLQESYVRAFHGLSGFAGRSALGTWLARIVRNEAIDRLRARRARSGTFVLEADLRTAPQRPSVIEQSEDMMQRSQPERTAASDEMKLILEHAIAELPEHFRCVFVMRALEGLSIRETSEYLGIPAATVKTRDHRARTLLRDRLESRIDAATKQAFAFLGSRCDALVRRVLARIAQ